MVALSESNCCQLVIRTGYSRALLRGCICVNGNKLCGGPERPLSSGLEVIRIGFETLGH